MLLIDYEYYSKNYGGSSIPESSFQKKAIEAGSKVNYYTSNRINEMIIDDNIRNTACEIADFIYSQDILKEKIIIILIFQRDFKLLKKQNQHQLEFMVL